MEIKEQFYGLIKEKGFTGLRDFARASGILASNIYSNLDGTYDLSINRAFVFAKVLKVPIDTILTIFYPDEMKELEKF